MPPESWTTHPRLRADEFARIAEFVQTTTGIKMPPSKRVMLETRLLRRVHALGLVDFSEYCALVFDRDGGEERQCLVDEVTTNKTEFFREPQHFEALLRMASDHRARTPFRVWSAGCATGEEPYSIAITLAEHARVTGEFPFEVAATDLCLGALRHAREAVYDAEALTALPASIRERYFMRGLGRRQGEVRVAPAVRQQVRFVPLNLISPEWQSHGAFDVIFCCNVLIYFERTMQVHVLSRLCDRLLPGGHLIVGHSETLHGMDLPLQFVDPTVYRKVVEQ